MFQRGGGLLLRAVELTLDGRKLGFALVGLLAVMVPTAFFFYLASVTGFAGAFLFSLLAGVVAWAGFSIVFGGLARMMVMELRTGQAVPWREALDQVRQHLITFLLSPLVLFLGFLGVLLGEMVVMFVGRIPYLGEILAVPLFALVFAFNVFLLLVIFFGAWLLFPIIANEGSGVIAALSRVVGLTRHAPAQITGYLLLAGFIGGMVILLLWGLLVGSWALSSTVALAGVGDKWWTIVNMPGVADFTRLYGLPVAFYRQVPFTIELARLLLVLFGAMVIAGLWLIPAVLQAAMASAVYLTVADPSSWEGPPPEAPEAP